MNFLASDRIAKSATTSRLFVATVLAITSLILPSRITLRAAKVEVINLTVDDQDISLRFVVCPKGTMIDGRPDVPGSRREEQDRELWILQTEVSYPLFSAVYGKARADDIFDTNIGNIDSQIQIVSSDKRDEFFENDFPMHGLTIEEAINFCEIVEKADPECQNTDARVSAIGYRLPTHAEWQYACRAAATVEEAMKKPHLPRWVKGPDKCVFLKPPGTELPKATLNNQAALLSRFFQKDEELPWSRYERRKWVDQKKEVPEDQDFTEFQEAFVAIISNALYGTSQARDQSMFFSLSLCGVKDTPKGLADQIDYVTNDWGIYHMQDNVPELALDDASGDKYYIEGGGKTVKHTTSIRQRNRWFIWGGLAMNRSERKFEEPEPGRKIDATLKAKRKRLCGFRIVRTAKLSDSWFDAIRLAGLQKGEHLAVANDISGKLRIVKELARDESFADKADSAAALYTVVSRFRNGGRLNDATIDDVTRLAEIDPYFRYLGQMLKDGE